MRFCLRSERVVTSEGIQKAAVAIDGGIIQEIREFSDIPPNWPVEDVGDLVVMPGLIDTHVHINEPGRTEWEGFETATRAAAAGGITTLVDMPLNSSPVTTTVSALRKKLSAAERKLYIDCGFYGGLVPGNTHEIPGLIAGGVLGLKAFLIHSGIDEFVNASEPDLRAGMPILAKHHIPLLVHCELQTKLAEPQTSNPRSYSAYLASRPRLWEHDAIALMVRLCREFQCRTHIVHLSSADAVPTLRAARRDGLPLTVETCPHYLFFTAEDIPDGDTRFKCAPPIRERENKERLWEGIKEGVVDCIVSDHSPSPPHMKLIEEGDFQKAWGGIASLQLGLSIVWTEARKRGFSIEHLAHWMCKSPAELVGLDNKKGIIAPGFDADLVLWEPEKDFTVEPDSLFHRHTLTPYEGRKLQGTIVKTYLRGERVFDDKRFPSEPRGAVLLRSKNRKDL